MIDFKGSNWRNSLKNAILVHKILCTKQMRLVHSILSLWIRKITATATYLYFKSQKKVEKRDLLCSQEKPINKRVAVSIVQYSGWQEGALVAIGAIRKLRICKIVPAPTIHYYLETPTGKKMTHFPGKRLFPGWVDDPDLTKEIKKIGAKMSVFDKIADSEQQKKESDLTLVAPLVNLYSALTYAEQGTVDANSIMEYIIHILNEADGFWVKEVTPYLDEIRGWAAIGAMPVSDLKAHLQDTTLSRHMHRALDYIYIMREKVEEGVKNYLERYKDIEFLTLLCDFPLFSIEEFYKLRGLVMLHALIIVLHDDTLSERKKSNIEHLQRHLGISDEIMIKIYSIFKGF